MNNWMMSILAGLVLYVLLYAGLALLPLVCQCLK